MSDEELNGAAEVGLIAGAGVAIEPSSPLVSAVDCDSVSEEQSALVVDLDGTLIRTDLLHEAVVRGIVHAPFKTARICLRLNEGRAAFKQAMAQFGTLDVAALPYRGDILDFIRAQRRRGRTIVLATASCREWANRIASHLQLFDHVLASDGSCNLKGAAKLSAIREFCQQHGFTEFAYIGDSRADLPIWEQASEAYLATHHSGLLRSLRRMNARVLVFDGGSSPVAAVFRLFRPHQWAKNAILFVPLIVSHRINDPQLLIRALVAFISFSLFASGVYVLNDFLDVDFDRRHHRKRRRPFASGELPLAAAIPLSFAAFLLGLTIAGLFLPMGYVAILCCYLIFTSAYSLAIKRIMIADVLVLAGLYVLRVFAGGIACDIPISDWLLTFSLFIFVSLGFLKRYVELTRISDDGLSVAAGRSYEVGDLSLIETMGTSCGFMAVVVLALYLQSEQVQTVYQNSRPLWFLCPILMYWLSRAWILARRRRMSDDPIAFALTDATSLTVVVVTLLLLVFASVAV